MQTKYGVNQPYDEGHKAGARGDKGDSNPYPQGTSDHQNWSEGHSESSQQEDKKGE